MTTPDPIPGLLFRRGEDYMEVWRSENNLRWLWVSGLTMPAVLRKTADLLEEGGADRYATKLELSLEDDRVTVGVLTEECR